MKPLSDTVITDSEDLIEVFEHADAEERVSMVQNRVTELKLLVSMLTDETEISPMGADIVDAAKQNLADVEEQLNRLYDMYLGVGAKNYSDLGVGEAVTGDYIGWGASRGEDAERIGHAGVDAPAILETPEASMILEELIKIANDLDKQGLRKEADYLDVVIKEAGFFFGGKKEALPETFEDFTDTVKDPSCDLACAEDAAMKYRSSEEYNAAPSEYEDQVAALVATKQGHEA
jgi:hypothetical protein